MTASQPLRIVVPIVGFGRAGGHRVLSNLATEWTRAGHEVRLLAHASNNAPYFPTEAQIVWLDDAARPVAHGTTGPDVTSKGGPFGVFANVRVLWRGLNRFAGDAGLVVANHSLSAWPVALTRTRARRSYYIQAYEPEYYAQAGRIQDRVLQALAWGSYRLPLRQVVNSPEYFTYPGVRAQSYVPPGLDFAYFYPGDRVSRDSRSFRVGCIGRHEPEKGTRYVIEAYDLLRATGEPFELHVAYGNLPERYAGRADIVVHTPRNDAELGDFYRSLDVLVAPGLVQHGAPHYPVMEAMACGVPVVNTGYMPATAENSWLVPPRDPDAIANALKAVRADTAAARGRVARGLEAVRPFAWPTVAAQLLDALLAT